LNLGGLEGGSAPFQISAGALADDNTDNATQIAAAGNTSGQATGLPDLLATINNRLFLFYSTTPNGYSDPSDFGLCAGGCNVLTGLNTPDGTQDWNSWTLATTQLSTGTALYLWNRTTGDLDLWTGLALDPTGTTLTTTGQYTVAGGWNTGKTRILQAADLAGTGIPDLWATDPATGTSTAYLPANLANNPALTTTTTATTTANHAWDFQDIGTNTAGSTLTSTIDSIGTQNLTGTTGTVWDTGDAFAPDALLNTGSDGITPNTSGTGHLASAGPAVNLSAAFTISAWVRPTAAGGVVASQDGVDNSGFLLYSQTNKQWAFCLATSDTTRAYDCIQGGTVLIGQWAHLTVTYDPATSATALYLNDRPVARGTHTAVSSSLFRGPFSLGDEIANGAHTGYFNGSLSDVQAWSGTALNESQISAMAGIPGRSAPYTFADTADWNGDGNPDVIAADAGGNLWFFPGNGSNGFSSAAIYLGSGFTGYTFAGVADFNKDGHLDLIAASPDGALRLYPGDAAHDLATPTIRFASGWAGLTFAGVADFNGDGNPDIIVRYPDGTLKMFPGTGSGAGLGTAVQIGTGWNGYTFAGVADLNHDGKQDVIVRDAADLLWLYPGNGSNGFGTRSQIGDGWGTFTFAGLADWNKDGNQDVIARDDAGLLWLYPRSATAFSTRVQIGHGW
ncbi:FG-GAP-like repeat-containing protein, partial [Streptacidiphilus sp. N1-12]